MKTLFVISKVKQKQQKIGHTEVGLLSLNQGCIQFTEMFAATRKQKQTFRSLVTVFGGR